MILSLLKLHVHQSFFDLSNTPSSCPSTPGNYYAAWNACLAHLHIAGSLYNYSLSWNVHILIEAFSQPPYLYESHQPASFLVQLWLFWFLSIIDLCLNLPYLFIYYFSPPSKIKCGGIRALFFLFTLVSRSPGTMFGMANSCSIDEWKKGQLSG